MSREKTVFVSGIGCSSRFPYYMATYNHYPRARACRATGVKLANRARRVDHHRRRRRIVDRRQPHDARAAPQPRLPDLLFNNGYGLIKGQYSPTSRIGTRSPSTPFGSVDWLLRPRFRARRRALRRRGIDVHKGLPDVLKAAHAHRGASFAKSSRTASSTTMTCSRCSPPANSRRQELWLAVGGRCCSPGN